MTSEPNKPKIYISELTIKTHFWSFFAIVSFVCCLPAIRPADLPARQVLRGNLTGQALWSKKLLAMKQVKDNKF